MKRDWVRGGMVQSARANDEAAQMTKLRIGFMPEFLIKALEPAKRIVRL